MAKEYLLTKIKEIASEICVKEDFIYYVYKDIRFIARYNEDDFPTFLLCSNDVKNYPHVIVTNECLIEGNNYSYVCLFEKDSISKHLLSNEDKIDYALNQFIRLFNLSKNEIIKEINREYKYHWNKAADTSYVSMIPYCDTYDSVSIYKYKKKGCKNKQKAIVAVGFPYDEDEYSVTIENCIYLNLNDINGVLPPPFVLWDYKSIKDLIFSLRRDRLSTADYERLNNLYVKEKCVLFFRVIEFDYFEFGVEISFTNSTRKKLRDKIESNEISDIKFIKLENQTIENSLHRNGQSPTKYKNVVLIGVGSLGSYIASELVKQGVKTLTLIDEEILTNENIARHYLGSNFIGFSKTKSMEIILSFSYPYLKVQSIDKKITETSIKEILDNINDVDLFIVATGNEDTELMINNYMMQRECFVPTIFCWLEANGIGSHVFCLNNKEDGCFKNVLESGISFVKNPFEYKIKNGCGGTFTKYGRQIVLNTVAMLLNVLVSEDNLSNTLYSYKEEVNEVNDDNLTDYYFSLKNGVTKVDIKQLKR